MNYIGKKRKLVFVVGKMHSPNTIICNLSDPHRWGKKKVTKHNLQPKVLIASFNKKIIINSIL